MTAFYENSSFSQRSIFSSGLSGLDGIEILKADRSPCPVCGHPTGDCAGDSPSPQKIWGMNTNSTLDDNQTFYVEEDYFEERQIAPGLVTRILIHKKGKNIPLSEAQKLGLIK